MPRFFEIPGYLGYLVSRKGEIQGPSGKILKPLVAHNGHLYILATNGLPRKLFLHRAVASTFLGPQPTPDHIVRHLNGKPTDNRVQNLAWGTQAENSQDRVRHGRQIAGHRHPNSNLTPAQVRRIRQSDLSSRALAKKFGCHHTTILRIKNEVSYREAK